MTKDILNKWTPKQDLPQNFTTELYKHLLQVKKEIGLNHFKAVEGLAEKHGEIVETLTLSELYLKHGIAFDTYTKVKKQLFLVPVKG